MPSLLPCSRLRLTTRQVTRRMQIRIGEQRRRTRACVSTSMRREQIRIAHQRQVDEILDRAAPELRTRSARIRAATSSSVGMRRPVDAQHAGGIPARPRPRGRSDRASCTDPRAGRRRPPVRPCSRRASASAASRSSAAANAPVRNSHSARCSSSAKMSSCTALPRSPPPTAPRRR